MKKYKINGRVYTQNEIVSLAHKEGLSGSEYLSKYKGVEVGGSKVQSQQAPTQKPTAQEAVPQPKRVQSQFNGSGNASQQGLPETASNRLNKFFATGTSGNARVDERTKQRELLPTSKNPATQQKILGNSVGSFIEENAASGRKEVGEAFAKQDKINQERANNPIVLKLSKGDWKGAKEAIAISTPEQIKDAKNKYSQAIEKNYGDDYNVKMPDGKEVEANEFVKLFFNEDKNVVKTSDNLKAKLDASALGKANKLITDAENGVLSSETDAQYLGQIAPKATSELKAKLGGTDMDDLTELSKKQIEKRAAANKEAVDNFKANFTSKYQIDPSQLSTPDQINEVLKTVDELKNGELTQYKDDGVLGFGTTPIIEGLWGGLKSVGGLMDEFSSYAAEKIYGIKPQTDEEKLARLKEFNGEKNDAVKNYENELENNIGVKNVNQKYASVRKDIARGMAIQKLSAVTNSDDAEKIKAEIEEKYWKIVDPEKGINIMKVRAGGKKSSSLDAPMKEFEEDYLFALGQSGNVTIQSFINKETKDLDYKYPSQKNQDVLAKLGAELEKQEDKNYNTAANNAGRFLFGNAYSIERLDRIANTQLTDDDRKFYYEKTRDEITKSIGYKMGGIGTNFLGLGIVPNKGIVPSLAGGVQDMAGEAVKSVANVAQIRSGTDVAADALEMDVEKAADAGIGKYGGFEQRLNELKKIPTDELTTYDLNEIKKLEEYGNLRNGLASFAEDAVGVVGQVYGIAKVAKPLQAFGKALGMSSEVQATARLASTEGTMARMAVRLGNADAVGLNLAGALVSYDAARVEAQKLFAGDPFKIALHTAIVTSANVASERMFNDTKFMQGFNSEVRNFVQNASVENMTREALQNGIRGALEKASKFAGYALKENNAEAIEEATVATATGASKLLLGAKGYTLGDASKEVLDIYTQTFVDGSLVGLMAGAKTYKDSRVGINLVSRAGQDPAFREDVKDAINKAFDAKEITKEQREERIKVLNTIAGTYQTSIASISKSGLNLDKNTLNKLALIITNKKIINSKIKEGGSDAVVKSYEAQLKELDQLENKLISKEYFFDKDYVLRNTEEERKAQEIANRQPQEASITTIDNEESITETTNPTSTTIDGESKVQAQPEAIQKVGQNDASVENTQQQQVVSEGETYTHNTLGEVKIVSVNENIAGSKNSIESIEVEKKDGTKVTIPNIENEGNGNLLSQFTTPIQPTQAEPTTQAEIPLIEIPKEFNVLDIAEQHKDKIPELEGLTNRPLGKTKAIKLITEYNQKATEQNEKAKAETQAQEANVLAPETPQVEAVVENTQAPRTIAEIDAEITQVEDSITEDSTNEETLAAMKKAKVLREQRQSAVNEISKPFDEQIKKLEATNREYAKEKPEGKFVEIVKAKVEANKQKIKELKGQKKQAIEQQTKNATEVAPIAEATTSDKQIEANVQPISPSGENGNEEQQPTAKFGQLNVVDKTKDIIDEVTDEKIGERKYQDFSIDFEDGARAFGTIENGVASISGINAPKKEGSVIEPKRGTKTYERVIENLKENGIKTINVSLQSQDSQAAISKLVEKGILLNPRDMKGVSDSQFATTFDIQPIKETPKTAKEQDTTPTQSETPKAETSKSETPQSEVTNTDNVVEEKQASKEQDKTSKKDGKKSNPKTTRVKKTKPIVEAIESEAEVVANSKDAERATELLETIERTTELVRGEGDVDSSFEENHGVSASEIANELNNLGKDGDLNQAYENVVGKKIEDYFSFVSEFLSELSSLGITLKNKVYVDIKKLQEDGNDIIINVEIKKGKAVKEVGIESLSSIVGKDELRPAQKGVFIDNGTMAATDGHRLVVLPIKEKVESIIKKVRDAYEKSLAKIIKIKSDRDNAIKERFDDKVKDGIDGKLFDVVGGGIINEKFPNYKQVLPIQNDFTDLIPIQELIDIANSSVNALKNINKSNPTAIMIKVGGAIGGFNPKYVLEILQAIQSSGAKQVKLAKQEGVKGLYIEADNGAIAMVMPIMTDGTPKTQTFEYPLAAKSDSNTDTRFSLTNNNEDNNTKNEIKNLNLQTLKKIANDYIKGARVFKRYTQAEIGGIAKGGEILSETILYLGANEATSNEIDQSEQQEALIEKYAKAKGVWVENTRESLTEQYGEPIFDLKDNQNQEAIVFAKDGNTLIKSQNIAMYGFLPMNKIDSIVLQNTYFKEGAVKVVGFGRDENGDFQVVIEQQFIEAHPTEKVTAEQIKNHLLEIGFEKQLDNNQYTDANSQIIVDDLHTANAILTPKGNIAVFDPLMRLNTEEEGYGGKREVDNSFDFSGTTQFSLINNNNNVNSQSNEKEYEYKTHFLEAEREELEGRNEILYAIGKIKEVFSGAISEDAKFEKIRAVAQKGDFLIDDLDQKLGEEDANGTESLVWHNEDGVSVTKAISYDLEGGVSNLIDKILVHNSTFPNSRIDVIAVGTLSDGTNVFIVSQPKVIYAEQSQMTKQQVIDYMELGGYKVIQDGDYPTFSNGRYEIADLHEGNIGITKEGNISVIDMFADIVRGKQDDSTDTQFSIATPSTENISLFEGKSKIPANKERLQKEFPNAVVVKNESELPDYIQKTIESKNAKGKVEGLFDPKSGKVYLVASNIPTMGRALGIYRHEFLGHKAVQAELGKKLGKFATQLVDESKGEQRKKIEERARLYAGKSIDQLTPQEKQEVGEEYIAKVAETPTQNPSVWAKIKVFVKRTLRSVGVPMTITDSEIQGLIARVERNVEKQSKAENRTSKKDPQLSKAISQADSIQLTYNDKGEHLAPNGKPSLLSEQQAKIVRTEAFKSWFGDWQNDPKNASKVVDVNGEPLVVYHGTENSFNEFDREVGNSTSGLKEFGNYFTDNKEIAKVYGNSLKEVFLNIRYLPEFDANRNTFDEGWRELKVDAGYKIADNRDAMEFIRDGKFGVKQAEGIKAKNIIDLTFYRPPTSYEKEKFIGNTYLVFDQYPNQIKLADGTNETFDPNTNDIRFSIYNWEEDTQITPEEKAELDELVEAIKSGEVELDESFLNQRAIDYVKGELNPQQGQSRSEEPKNAEFENITRLVNNIGYTEEAPEAIGQETRKANEINTGEVERAERHKLKIALAANEANEVLKAIKEKYPKAYIKKAIEYVKWAENKENVDKGKLYSFGIGIELELNNILKGKSESELNRNQVQKLINEIHKINFNKASNAASILGRTKPLYAEQVLEPTSERWEAELLTMDEIEVRDAIREILNNEDAINEAVVEESKASTTAPTEKKAKKSRTTTWSSKKAKERMGENIKNRVEKIKKDLQEIKEQLKKKC